MKIYCCLKRLRKGPSLLGNTFLWEVALGIGRKTGLAMRQEKEALMVMFLITKRETLPTTNGLKFH